MLLWFVNVAIPETDRRTGPSTRVDNVTETKITVSFAQQILTYFRLSEAFYIKGWLSSSVFAIS